MSIILWRMTVEFSMLFGIGYGPAVRRRPVDLRWSPRTSSDVIILQDFVLANLQVVVGALMRF